MSFKNLYKASPPELKQIVMDQWKAKQNPQHHPEGNTLKHIIVVTDRAFRDFPDNKDIQLAAYFHDLGKLATYAINPKSGQPTAYGHEEESVELIDQFREFVQQQGANPEIVKYIVKNHMKIKPSTWDVMKPSKKDPIINDPHYKDLEKFGTIDKGGLLEFKYLYKSNKRMKTQINEIKRMQQLAGILKEGVEVPSWLGTKLEKVHTKVGQGSVFTKSIPDVLKIVQDALDKNQDVDKIANSTGILTIQSPGIGYNLVLPIEQAEKLPGAKKIDATKLEGPLGNETEIKVPGISTTAPLNQFKTNDLTVIVRPKKDKDNNPIPGEYIVLSAYPGPKEPEIPRASEWNGKYAVIIPGGKDEVKENKLFEVLDDLTDAQSASTFIKDQLSTYIDNSLSDYGAGYQLEEKLDKLLNLVSKKFNIPGNSFKVEDKYSTSYNEYDEATVKGEIKINGQVVIDYSSHGDGYGFSADIDENALKAQLEKLMKPTNEVFNKLDEIVDKALSKIRKQLNENISPQEFEETIDELTYELIQDEYMGDTPTDLQSVADIISARAEGRLGQKVEFQLVQGDKIAYDIPGTDPYLQYTYSF